MEIEKMIAIMQELETDPGAEFRGGVTACEKIAEARPSADEISQLCQRFGRSKSRHLAQMLACVLVKDASSHEPRAGLSQALELVHLLTLDRLDVYAICLEAIKIYCLKGDQPDWTSHEGKQLRLFVHKCLAHPDFSTPLFMLTLFDVISIFHYTGILRNLVVDADLDLLRRRLGEIRADLGSDFEEDIDALSMEIFGAA